MTPSAAPVVTEEFETVMARVAAGASPLFVTGRAGTGKSTLLRMIRDRFSDGMAVLAPTGLAAVQVGGATIHSFFLFPPRLVEARDIRLLKHKTKVFKRLKSLVIDEVSMVRADLMNAVDLSLRLHRGDDRPFGGVQMLLFGDLYQLPPVVREQEMGDYFERVYRTPYFFSAPVFREAPVHGFPLTRVFRQRDEDFLRLLEKIRTGEAEEDDVLRLNRSCAGRALPGAVVLTARNATADRINAERLEALPGQAKTYTAVVDGKFGESAHPADLALRLKKGARVMFVKNNGALWTNGTLGEVESLGEDAVRVRVGDALHEVAREKWKVVGYKPSADGEGLDEEELGRFEQFPLRLAWAVTIHKSQGLTLDAAEIDLDGGAFAHGQLYVALSRCRELSGVRLRRPVQPRDVLFDPRVKDFHESLASLR